MLNRRRIPRLHYGAISIFLLGMFTPSLHGQAGKEVTLHLTLRAGAREDAAEMQKDGAGCYLVQTGEPIYVQYTIRNNADVEVSLATSDLAISGKNFKVVDSRENRLPSGPTRERPRAVSEEKLLIPLTKSHSGSVDLLELFQPESLVARNARTLLTPDTYVISMTFTVDPLPTRTGLWSGTLESASIKLKVTDLPDEAKRKLADGFKTAKPAEHARTAILLMATSKPHWGPDIAGYLKDENATVRCAALFYAARVSGPPQELLTEVTRVLSEDQDAVVRASAAFALGELGSKDAVPALIEAVRTRQDRSYREAVRSLGKLRDDRAVDVLKDVAKNDPEPWVREAAAKSIRQIQAGNPK